eukprot:scaffold273302_cov17-Tisochrysis_lutea.AAC.1
MLHHNTKGCSGLNAASQERLKVEIAKLWLSLLLPAEVWGAHLKATCVGKCRHASERQNILKLPNRSSYQRYLPVQQASVTTIHRGCCREEFNKLVWPSWGCSAGAWKRLQADHRPASKTTETYATDANLLAFAAATGFEP